MAAVVVVAAGVVYAASQGGDGGDGCGDRTRRLDSVEYGEAPVEVVASDGEAVRLCVLLADTALRRQHGLMRVADLGEHDGMVFVFDADSTGSFWMGNTLMPLSIAWFRADGAFVSAADMDPCPQSDSTCPRYAPKGPYRSALEVPKGELAALGIGEGSRLRLDD